MKWTLLIFIALTACNNNDDDDPYMLKTLKPADLQRLNEIARETHNYNVEHDTATLLRKAAE